MKRNCFNLFLIGLGLGVLAPVYPTSIEMILKEMRDYEADAKKRVNDITILLEVKDIAKGKESIGYELVMRKGDRYRLERTRPDSILGMPIVLFDGKNTWAIDSLGNKMITHFEEWRLRPYLTWDWSSLIPSKSRVMSIEDIGGRHAYCIELPRGWLSLPFKVIWLDTQKPVLVRAKSTRTLLVYSEYQLIMERVEIPYRTETFSGGGDFITMTTVKSVGVNQGMSDDLFNLDSDEAKGLRIPAMLSRLKLIEEEQ